jgi:hypothetical protein
LKQIYNIIVHSPPNFVFAPDAMLDKALKLLCKMLKMSCKLLKSRDVNSWCDSLLEFQKQSALEKAEESDPTPNEKTMKFSNFSDRLRFIDVNINVSEDTYLKKKQTEIKKELWEACRLWGDSEERKYIFISSDIWLLISSCYHQGLLHPYIYLLDIWGDHLDIPSTIPKEVPSSETVVSLSYTFL